MKTSPLKIAIAQINATVGDIEGNAAKILSHYEKAKLLGADLVAFPELALVGYSPQDMVLMPAFRKAAAIALKELARRTAKGPAMVVGSVVEEKKKIYNAAVLLADGKIAHVQPKIKLPNYGVFDEKRVYDAGKAVKAARWRGRKIGMLVCEDSWHPELSRALKKQKAEVVISINASPFEAKKLALRKKAMAAGAKAAAAPFVYVNMVGGQDDVVFDGGSFVLDKQGKVTAQLPEFQQEVVVMPLASRQVPYPALAAEESLWQAMMLGLCDYVKKNGFSQVVLGLSGGIDSALTAAAAVDALGAKNVRGVLLPSPYTSRASVEDAEALAKNLGIGIISVPITEAMETFEERLSPVFRDAGWMEDVAVGGNLQARLRGVTLMALSNKFGWLLLSTGNKSEIATGYTTLYGDACGGYNVVKDLYKTQVYALAKWRNRKQEIIPARILAKPPSAELKPGQKDEDTLPPYAMLDKILMLHIEGRKSAAEIAAKGFNRATVERVLKMVRLSEYKRRQSAPGVKLSPMLFGKDRRYPLTNKF